MMKPYKRKIAFEAVIKAIMTGLLLGASSSLFMALFFTLVLRQNSLPFIIASAAVGGVVALITGIWMYNKRFKANAKRFASRIDSLGLEERVVTMVQYQADTSYVAKVQRDDTMDRLSGLRTKQLKVRTPYFSFISAVAMVLAIILLFMLVPMPSIVSATEIEEEVEEDLKKELIEQLIEEIRELIREAEDIDPETGENHGINKDFANSLYDIVDALEEEVNEIDEDDTLTADQKILKKYERIRETRKAIEDLIRAELERLKDLLDDLTEEEPKDPNDEVLDQLEDTILKELAEAIRQRDIEKVNIALDNLKALLDNSSTSAEKMGYMQQMIDALDDAIDKRSTNIIKALDDFRQNLETALEKEKAEENSDLEVIHAFDQAKDDLAYALSIDELLNALIKAVYNNEGIDEAIDAIMEAIESANDSQAFAKHMARDLRAYMDTVEGESDLKDVLLAFADGLENLEDFDLKAIKEDMMVAAEVSFKLTKLAKAIEARDTNATDKVLDSIGEFMKNIDDNLLKAKLAKAYAKKLMESIGDDITGRIPDALRFMAGGMQEIADKAEADDRDVNDKIDYVIEETKKRLKEAVDILKDKEDVVQDIEDKIDQAEKDLVGEDKKEVDDMMDDLRDIVDNSNVQNREPFDQVLDDLQDKLDQMLQDNASKDELNSAISDAKDQLNDMLQQEQQKWQDASDAFQDAADNQQNEDLKDAFQDMADALESMDSDKMQEAFDKIKDAYKDVTDPGELNDMFQDIADAFDQAAQTQPDDSVLKDVFENLRDEFKESADMAQQGQIDESKENADDALDDAFENNNEQQPSISDAFQDYEDKKETTEDMLDQMQQAQDKIQPNEQTSQPSQSESDQKQDSDSDSESDSDQESEEDSESKNESSGEGGGGNNNQEVFKPGEGKTTVDDVLDNDYMNDESGKKFDVEGSNTGSGGGRTAGDLMDMIDDYIDSFGK